jgi:hypothetical protein
LWDEFDKQQAHTKEIQQQHDVASHSHGSADFVNPQEPSVHLSTKAIHCYEKRQLSMQGQGIAGELPGVGCQLHQSFSLKKAFLPITGS